MPATSGQRRGKREPGTRGATAPLPRTFPGPSSASLVTSATLRFVEVIRTLHRHLRPTSHAGRICEPGHPTPCPKFGVAHCVWGPGEQPAAVPAEGQPSSHVVSFPTGPAPTSGSAHFNKFYLAAKLTQDEFCTRSRNRWIQAHLPAAHAQGRRPLPAFACLLLAQRR